MAEVEDSGNAENFAQLLGIRALESVDGVGRSVMPVQKKHLQLAGVVQGGIIVALADHALHLAVSSTLSQDEFSVTVELKVNFIAPASDGELTAEGRVVSRGNRIVVGEMDVTDAQGAMVAKGMGTCMVRARR